MSLEIRRLTAEESQGGMRTFATAMLFPVLTGPAWEQARERAYPERSFGAFERGEMVGHARSYPFETLVPGGALVATAGVSAVGTLPTHRRRGVLTQLMTTLLQDCHSRGEPLASLRASEAAIYGRFGYGLAGQAASVEISTRTGGLRRRLADHGTFTYQAGPELLELLPALARRCLRRPGMVTMPTPLWKRTLGPLASAEHAEARWVVVHRDERGRPDGFVDWEAIDRDHWFDRPATIEVGDVLGTTPEVEALLWQFVFDLDLVHVVKCDSRPLDDPVRWMLNDVRAYRTTAVWDEQWVRVVDVPAALAARTYPAVDVAVVIEVTDPLLPANDGHYEISATGVRRVRRAADVALGIDTLGAVYLGGTSLSELCHAGWVTEHRRGGVARADLLLHSPVRPWCGTFF